MKNGLTNHINLSVLRLLGVAGFFKMQGSTLTPKNQFTGFHTNLSMKANGHLMEAVNTNFLTFSDEKLQPGTAVWRNDQQRSSSPKCDASQAVLLLPIEGGDRSITLSLGEKRGEKNTETSPRREARRQVGRRRSFLHTLWAPGPVPRATWAAEKSMTPPRSAVPGRLCRQKRKSFRKASSPGSAASVAIEPTAAAIFPMSRPVSSDPEADFRAPGSDRFFRGRDLKALGSLNLNMAASAARGVLSMRANVGRPVAFVRKIPWTAASSELEMKQGRKFQVQAIQGSLAFCRALKSAWQLNQETEFALEQAREQKEISFAVSCLGMPLEFWGTCSIQVSRLSESKGLLLGNSKIYDFAGTPQLQF